MNVKRTLVGSVCWLVEMGCAQGVGDVGLPPVRLGTMGELRTKSTSAEKIPGHQAMIDYGLSYAPKCLHAFLWQGGDETSEGGLWIRGGCAYELLLCAHAPPCLSAKAADCHFQVPSPEAVQSIWLKQNFVASKRPHCSNSLQRCCSAVFAVVRAAASACT